MVRDLRSSARGVRERRGTPTGLPPLRDHDEDIHEEPLVPQPRRGGIWNAPLGLVDSRGIPENHLSEFSVIVGIDIRRAELVSLMQRSINQYMAG
jgi:hypothetical protein